MKLRDLARGSRSSTSFAPAFHVLRSRFGNRETARQSWESYESVPRSSPTTPHILTSLQQTTMVPLSRMLHRRRHPSSPLTLSARTHHGDQTFHQRTCHWLVSLYFLIFEQNQSKVYREVLIAGDLTSDDVQQADYNLWEFQSGWLSYGRSTSGTAEFVYDNDSSVYFAQPNLSQLVPGGSGPGAFDRSGPAGLGYDPGNTPALTGKSATKRDSGAVLRHVPPRQSCSSTS